MTLLPDDPILIRKNEFVPYLYTCLAAVRNGSGACTHIGKLWWPPPRRYFYVANVGRRRVMWICVHKLNKIVIGCFVGLWPQERSRSKVDEGILESCETKSVERSDNQKPQWRIAAGAYSSSCFTLAKPQTETAEPDHRHLSFKKDKSGGCCGLRDGETTRASEYGEPQRVYV